MRKEADIYNVKKKQLKPPSSNFYKYNICLFTYLNCMNMFKINEKSLSRYFYSKKIDFC